MECKLKTNTVLGLHLLLLLLKKGPGLSTNWKQAKNSNLDDSGHLEFFLNIQTALFSFFAITEEKQYENQIRQ